jgi:hypothetical protein
MPKMKKLYFSFVQYTNFYKYEIHIFQAVREDDIRELFSLFVLQATEKRTGK